MNETPEWFLKMSAEEQCKFIEEAGKAARIGLAASLNNGWISVEDMLPEEKLPVIVAFDKCFKMPDIAYRKDGEWWFAYDESLGSCESKNITARYWQPLPEPPKEDKT